MLSQAVVLLGAGASVEGGIPASIAMTKGIVEIVDDAVNRHYGISQALHYAIGAMIAHDTAQGGRAFDGVDVERLFAAIQMLGDRDSLEVAPFVASWSPALENLGARQFPPFFEKDFREAIFKERVGKIERIFRDAVQATTGTSDWPAAFRALQPKMIMALRTLTAVDPRRVNYLSPLLNVAAPVEIATLNYDRSIEELALRAGMLCDTGIEAWDGGAQWHWREDASIRLLKLHGSVDWQLTERREEGCLPDHGLEVLRPGFEPDAPRSSRPAVIFGARGKLQAEGPFLPMLLEFDQMLARHEHLVVVGYSFRDAHINSSIRRWLNGSTTREITVVDPAPVPRDHESFLSLLQQTLNRKPFRGESYPDRLHLHQAGASEGLVRVFGPGPVLLPYVAEAESAP